MERLRPLNDFIFKKLFGEPESKENLRAFLNAILYNNIGNIKDMQIAGGNPFGARGTGRPPAADCHLAGGPAPRL